MRITMTSILILTATLFLSLSAGNSQATRNGHGLQVTAVGTSVAGLQYTQTATARRVKTGVATQPVQAGESASGARVVMASLLFLDPAGSESDGGVTHPDPGGDTPATAWWLYE